jgi:hypothetical protein
MAMTEKQMRFWNVVNIGLVFSLWMMAAGCANPEEGTVTVSPEARARLRGGSAPGSTKANTKGKSNGVTKPTVDVREKSRRPTAD